MSVCFYESNPHRSNSFRLCLVSFPNKICKRTNHWINYYPYSYSWSEKQSFFILTTLFPSGHVSSGFDGWCRGLTQIIWSHHSCPKLCSYRVVAIALAYFVFQTQKRYKQNASWSFECGACSCLPKRNPTVVSVTDYLHLEERWLFLAFWL